MPRGTFIARIAVLTALAAVLAACGRPPPASGPVQVEIDGISTEVRASERFAGVYDCGEDQVDVRVTVGTTTTGDDFVLVVPRRDWSGDLVVFAHGYRDPALPAGFWEAVPDDFSQVLDALGDLSSGDPSGGVGQAMALALCSFTVDLGFGDPLEKAQSAFAASSYSANGYATDVAVPETHVLNALFSRYIGPPVRTYVTGASLGGIVALELAERYPERYDGALPVCGPVGGSLLHLSYVGHVELMFRYVYPGAFDDGSTANIDLTVPITAVGKADIIELAGGFPFGNQDVTYYRDAGAIVDPVLDVRADPEALAYVADHYQPSGRLQIPTVTVHNHFDPVVPAFHESAYDRLVTAEGWGSNLATAIVPFEGAGTSTPAFGHCGFADEVFVAFAALSEWVESGSKPWVLGSLSGTAHAPGR